MLKAVHIVGPHPPANSVRCFEDSDIQPTGGQSPRATQPRETSADNNYIAIDNHRF